MSKRQRLTKFEYATIFLEQKGRCGCGCGERLAEGKVDEEHTIPNYFKPGKPDALWLKVCHKRKTAKDKGDIAHIKALEGKTGQKKRRDERGGSSIQSRGFDKQFKKK